MLRQVSNPDGGFQRQITTASEWGDDGYRDRSQSVATPGGKRPPQSGLLGRIEKGESRMDRMEITLMEMQAQSKHLKLGFKQHEWQAQKVAEDNQHVLDDLGNKVEAKIEDLGKDMQSVILKVQSMSGAVRNDFQTLQDAQSSAAMAHKQVKTINICLAKTNEELAHEFDRVARSLQHLSNEIKTVRSSLVEGLRGELAEAKSQMAGQGSQTDIGTCMNEIYKRQEDAIVGQRKLMQHQERLDKQVKACVRKDEMQEMKRAVSDMDGHQKSLKQYVTEQMFNVNKDKAKSVLDSWMQKKAHVERSEMYQLVFAAWNQYIDKRQQMREAMGRTQHQYARTHITEWVRSWWYIMQKEYSESKFQSIQEETTNQSVQIEMLLASFHRSDKTSNEQVKQLNQRIGALEKQLQELADKKADKEMVTLQFEELEARLTWQDDLNVLGVRIEENGSKIAKLETSKYDNRQGQQTREALDFLTLELRAGLRATEDRIALCAAKDAVFGKADAKMVEDVSILLAKQADQVANLVAVDLANVKLAMARFLELSPDLRKAALSVGLEPNEQCVGCRAVKRQLIPEMAVGFDGNTYRLDPLQMNKSQEEAYRILQDKLGLPSVLASSLAAGATVQGRSPSPHNNGERPPSAQQQLRLLLNQSPGWVGGSQQHSSELQLSRPQTPSTPWGGGLGGGGRSPSPELELVPKRFFPAVPGGAPGSPGAILGASLGARSCSAGLGDG
mmetsp:Transcript_68764/g.223956  ORF Transcript_68764/g.223956 Transcript_68764/m.223956 type:complete len:730 (-) Transcript_68764:3229-5418(-)